MQHRKMYKLFVLILVAALMLSGCKEDVSFILPAEANEDTVLMPSSTPTTDLTSPTTTPSTNSDDPTLESTTAPSELSTDPSDSATDPTQSVTAPSDSGDNVSGTDPVESTIPSTGGTDNSGKSGNSNSSGNSNGSGNSGKSDNSNGSGDSDNSDNQQTAPTEHQHSYTKSVVEPTCSERGYTKHTCACGDSYNNKYTNALGHDYKDTIVEPTVSKRGYTLHKCSRCDYSYKDTYTDKLPSETEPTGPSHKHSYSKTVVAPTCTEKGYTKYTCACGDIYYSAYKDPLGHDYKNTVVDPTVDKRGYTLHKCTRCGYSYKDSYTDKLPTETEPTSPPEHKHSYTKSVVAPTCTEKGYTKYTCACGDSYTNNTKAALGHDYKVTVVEPTIEERGYNLHKCTRCGDSYKDNYVDKLPPHTEPPETEPPETEPSQTEHEVYDISDHVVGSLEYEILAVINQHRAEAGLGELKMDKKLCALAKIRAYEASISFSHTRPDGRSCFTVLTDYNYRGGSIAGENLLHASPGYAASKLVNVWMKSTSHKDNILTESFTKAGLGIYYANGRMYVANLFAG